MESLTWVEYFSGLLALLLIIQLRQKIVAYNRTKKLFADDSFFVRKTSAPCREETKVTIIIPARNEEDNIGDCVAQALAQTHQNLEVIVYNDKSTDKTGDILARITDSHLTVIKGEQEPPNGWRGKPWACQSASRHATGDWLMFIDADVRIAPETVAAIVGRCEQNNLEFFTGLDKHIFKSFGERTLHAFMLFSMGFQRNWLDIRDPQKKESMGNGRFLVFKKSLFESLHGFEPVANKVVEDEALGKLIKEKGITFDIQAVSDLVSVRMYDSTKSTWLGWRKTTSGAVLDSNGGHQVSLPASIGLFAILLMKFMFFDSFLSYLILILAISAVLPLWLLPFALAVIVMDHVNRALFAKVMDLNRWQDALCHLPGLLMMLPLYLLTIKDAVSGSANWKGRNLIVS